MQAQHDPRRRFAAALFSAIARGRFRFAGGHRPPAGGHAVDPAFAGVGVAAAADPAVDDFIVERLRETGIRHVRMDFSAADEGAAGERLLRRLLADDFRVTLHLIQLREDALAMPGEPAAGRWQGFVARTLDRHGAEIERIELGTTVNRQRWSGHSLAGFLAMWETGWREVRQRGLTLVGPGVTDFEPPWSVGILALLAERGQLPDIHGNNLFSERCTEPERFDHKILGHRLVRLHKFNLIKKARLLARLGADHGVPRLVSPAAFWTLPRIERRLPDSEEKQADYLARYLLLGAASGALERAWWGPLICHREGLVDNGERPYPVLERIAHYASVEGGRDDLRMRPALHTLGAFAALVSGSRYEGRLNATEGLEVHAFRSAERLVHAVWTINGRAAALVDLYRPEDLAAATALGRDGESLADMPTLATEAPVYLCWPATAEPSVRREAALLPGVSVHRHARGVTHFFHRENGWQGIVLAANARERDALLAAIRPEAIGAPVREATLRHARNAIWTIAHPTRPERRLVVKQPVRVPWYKRLLDRNKPAKGLRSWSGAAELLRLGVGTATPVAWFEKVGDETRMQNFYLCEYVDAPLSFRELFSAYAAGADSHAGIAAADAYRKLCRFLLKMHGGGVFFRDLSGGNILVRPEADGDFSCTLIDTGRIRVYRDGVPLSARLSDLSRICNKLHWAGREALVGEYLAAIGKTFGWRHRLPFHLYDAKVRLKRRVGRKAIRRWLNALRTRKRERPEG
ncbi:MAG: hypothetical protein RBT86_02015 [Azospira sp.]|jgi:hypothetical protein|nr:hypothetical protein [Azospira sp.]